ncbi:MAG: hypothetical protein RBU21_16275, partial [FCB group bacterium]|nr:hypothetical protein [FCB group bacterium]
NRARNRYRTRSRNRTRNRRFLNPSTITRTSTITTKSVDYEHDYEHEHEKNCGSRKYRMNQLVWGWHVRDNENWGARELPGNPYKALPGSGAF